MNLHRHYRQHVQSGTTVVEAALVMPFILMASLGVIEYGWMFVKAEEINMAARQGARIASLNGKTSADALVAIDAIMADRGITQYVVNFAPAAPSGLDSGERLTVTVTAQYEGALSLINVPLLPLPSSLQAEVSMAKEAF